MEHASSVDIGARKRRTGGINEDSIAVTVLENHHRATARPIGIFVLGDGVGGEASGDVASFLATSIIRERLTSELVGDGTDILEEFDIDPAGYTPPSLEQDPEAVLSPERIEEAIQNGIDAAHQQIQQFAREIDGRPATTVVVGVYVDGRLYYGWVGDSRAYLINAEHEEIEQLTTDHAVTNRLLERGEIEDEVYARIHEDATAITNVVGGSGHGKPTVDVEFGAVDVYAEDVIMITSDGLIDAYPQIHELRQQYHDADDTDEARDAVLEELVTDEEIMEIVLGADDLQTAVDELIAFANERGGKDNLSITLAQDPECEPTPDELEPRGEETGPSLTDRTTTVEEADDGTESTESTDEDAADVATEESESPAPADDNEDDRREDANGEETAEPTAAITVGGKGTVFEVTDGVTIGVDSDEETTERSPNIGIVVDDDAVVERNHTRLEYRQDDDEWHVRDISTSGTYVEVGDGEWMLLLSSEGEKFHRKHGFDPGAVAEQELKETYRLEDGTVFTPEDPRNDRPISFRFFSSVEAAREYTNESPDEPVTFERFLP